MSIRRFKLFCVLSSCLKDSSFFLVYKPIPAASSKIVLLSSGLLSANQLTVPCEIIPSEPLDKPVSTKTSIMSLSLACSPFMK